MEFNPLRPSRDWRLSEAFYLALHQWPFMLIFCLVGALLGLVASDLWPAVFRTRAEIYVVLNPYRAYSDSWFIARAYPQYTNVDDYKNWQMSQLSAAILTDEVIDATMADLRQEDAYWKEVDNDRLRSMLRAEWRTAGTWTLLADSRNAKRSNQAVRSWSRTVVRRVEEAVLAAEQIAEIDERMRTIIGEQTKTAVQQQDFQTSQRLLQEWLGQAGDLPADQPLSQEQRWEILYLTGRVAQFSPGWLELLEKQPGESALPEVYIDWIEQILVAIEGEAPLLAQRADFLEQQRLELQEEYDRLVKVSLGLSPNLVVKGLEKTLPEVLRSTIQLVILGAIGGLLLWVIWLLAMITWPKVKL